MDTLARFKPKRADATVSDVAQTKGSVQPGPGGRRPDESMHKLSDELAKEADEGALGKK